MKYALGLLICFFFVTIFGQEDEQIIIVKRESSTHHSRPRKPELDIDNYNAFKFDPFRMAIGELNFSWEHRIDDHTTFELELGPTISNLNGNRNYVTDDVYEGSYRTNSGMGVLVSAAVRYYPLDDFKAMNKLYISPRVKYRRYNETYSSSMGGVSDQAGGSNEFIFSFNIGYQQWFSHNFAFDYYVGMGIGNFSGNKYYLSETYDGNTNAWTYTWKEQKAQYARVLGVIGMKVTIGN